MKVRKKLQASPKPPLNNLDISVQDLQDALPINVNSAHDVVAQFFSWAKLSCDEIMVYFVDTKTICDLHDKHFNDPSPTDCISIQVDPIGSSPCFLGEIFISTDAAIEFCKENKELIYQEITLYLVHGLLHLIGYDDIESDDALQMREAENKCMKYLMLKNAIVTK